MKKILIPAFLACALVGGTAQAQQVFSENDADYCQNLAALATAYAADREKGIHLEDLHDHINTFEFDDGPLWDVRYTADFVYTYPRSTPSEEGNMIYKICRDGY